MAGEIFISYRRADQDKARLLHAAGQMLGVLDEVVVEEQLMLMTDANGFVSQIHNRMPALLDDGQLEEYLAGDIRDFPPPEMALAVADAVNPLKKKRGEEQGELF